MKFGQLTEYNMKNIISENHVENEEGRPVPDLFNIKLRIDLTYSSQTKGLKSSIFLKLCDLKAFILKCLLIYLKMIFSWLLKITINTKSL